MKELRKLRWNPKWVTHLGCIKGCMEYLGIDIADAWLFGATGHAFILNIHEVVCPSGPTAWNYMRLLELCRNLGVEVDTVSGQKSDKDFAHKQERAFRMVRESIDKGIPCYGWELAIPEFYVIHGYDENGYYYRDFDNSSKGPKPWTELGDTGIGMLEVHAVKECEPADDSTTIKESIGYILEISQGLAKWIFPKYRAGPDGYDYWIEALEAGKADGFGNAYNAAVWNECRAFAVKFLVEAREKLGDGLSKSLDQAIEHYSIIAKNMESFTNLFPFTGPDTKGNEVKDPEWVKRGLKHLRAARTAEASGLETLGDILEKLN